MTNDWPTSPRTPTPIAAPRGRLDDGLVFDAVRVRLIEIGEAIKDISAELLATESDAPA